MVLPSYSKEHISYVYQNCLLHIYHMLKTNNKGSRLKNLRFDSGNKIINYEEHGRKYLIMKVGKFYFLRPEHHNASCFKDGEEMMDLIIEGIQY